MKAAEGVWQGCQHLKSPAEQAQQMQQQLMSAQQQLSEAEVSGSAGGGLVSATVSGTGELKSVSIDPKAADPEDTETLSDLVVAAVRDANRAAQELQAEKMGPLSGALGGQGAGLGIPGM